MANHLKAWKKINKLNGEEIRTLQNKKLNHFINHYLYPFSPYYKNLFDQNNINPKSIKTVDDLKHVPFTTKDDFLNTPESEERFLNFVLRPNKGSINASWPLSKKLPLALRSLFQGKATVEKKLTREFKPLFMSFTTGTTHRPVPFLYSDYDLNNLKLSGARLFETLQLNPNDYLLNMFPYAPHLAFWQVVLGGFASSALILSTGGGKVVGTEGNIAAMIRLKPSVVIGVPSYVYHVFREAKEKDVNCAFVKKVVLGASKITMEYKKKLSELLGSLGAHDVSIFGTYGFTEARCAWVECPTELNVPSGYHSYPDKEIFEIIDPESGEVKREGESGELVYTSLDSRGSSVLRYRTGDFVEGGIRYDACPYCSKTVPRISSPITRLSDTKEFQMTKIKGSLVNFNNFETAFSEISLVEEWQVEIRKKDDDPFENDEIVVYATPGAFCDIKDLEIEIHKKMALYTELRPNMVKFLTLKEMIQRLELETANKEKRIVDKRILNKSLD